MKKATIALLLICTAAFAQQKGSFTDTRDKKTYKTVKIGEQTWMAENLNYDAKGSKCYGEGGEVYIGYDGENDIPITKTLSPAEMEANCKKYGRLYNWATAMNIDAKFNEEKWDGSDVKHSGICPSGWHLPNDKEWQTLVDFAGGNSIAGKKLKAKSGWNKTPDNKNSNGTDNYGFSALPGGTGNSDGSFNFAAGNYGYWYSASENDIYMSYTYEDEDYGPDDVYGLNDGPSNKSDLYSVRCVKD